MFTYNLFLDCKKCIFKPTHLEASLVSCTGWLLVHLVHLALLVVNQSCWGSWWPPPSEIRVILRGLIGWKQAPQISTFIKSKIIILKEKTQHVYNFTTHYIIMKSNIPRIISICTIWVIKWVVVCFTEPFNCITNLITWCKQKN